MLPRDVYEQPDAPDVPLDDDAVLRIARRHGLFARAVTGVDESGGEARVYLIDNEYVLKTQRPHRVRRRTSLEKEAFFLNQLRGQLEIAVPAVVGHGRAGGTEYLCMTRVPGVAAATVVLRQSSRARLLWELGRQLRRIHDLPLRPFVDSRLFPGPATHELAHERFRHGFLAAVEKIEREGIAWPLAVRPAAIAEQMLADLAGQLALAPLHSNPGPEHVFVDPVTEEISALIDFGDAYVGHPGFDWRWPSDEDGFVMLSGYSEGGELTDDFLRAWKASVVLADLVAIADRPDRRDVALASLEKLVGRDVGSLRGAIPT